VSLSIVVSIGLSWGIVEGLSLVGLINAREWFSEDVGRPWQSRYNRLDPELLYIHQPFMTIQGRMVGGDFGQVFDIPDPCPHEFSVRTDRDGFRNVKDMDEADVVVLGDSYVEGVIVPYEQIMTSQLSMRLKVPVLNLGQVGYGPDQELIVFKRYGLPRRPKVCVWCFFEGNDLSDMVEYQFRKLGWQERMQLMDSPTARSFTLNLLAFLERPPASIPKLMPVARCNIGTTPAGVKMYFFHQSDALRKGEVKSLRRLTEILTEWSGLCSRHAVRPVFVYVPTKVRVYADICRFEEGSSSRRWFVEPLKDQIRGIVEDVSSGITFLDLTEVLKLPAKQADDTYFSDDSHWTPSGHRVVADAIADLILDFQRSR
jgi:hypothetical protein